MKKKPKKVRRVVLGVGHPWFWKSKITDSGWGSVSLWTSEPPYGSSERKRLKIGSLGGYNKIRLVAEVLE